MTKFSPLVDVNTKVVYEWSNDVGEKVVIYSDNWKPVKEWTQEEIESLFSSPDLFSYTEVVETFNNNYTENEEDSTIHLDLQ